MRRIFGILWFDVFFIKSFKSKLYIDKYYSGTVIYITWLWFAIRFESKL